MWLKSYLSQPPCSSHTWSSCGQNLIDHSLICTRSLPSQIPSWHSQRSLPGDGSLKHTNKQLRLHCQLPGDGSLKQTNKQDSIVNCQAMAAWNTQTNKARLSTARRWQPETQTNKARLSTARWWQPETNKQTRLHCQLPGDGSLKHTNKQLRPHCQLPGDGSLQHTNKQDFIVAQTHFTLLKNLFSCCFSHFDSCHTLLPSTTITNKPDIHTKANKQTKPSTTTTKQPDVQAK